MNRYSGYSISSEAEYLGDKNLSLIELDYNYSSNYDEDKGETLINYYGSVSLRNDYLLNKIITIYTSSDYYFYSKNAGSTKLEGSAGVGYYLFKHEVSDFLISIWPAFIWQEDSIQCSLGSNCGELQFATNVEVAFTWLINKNLEFSIINTYISTNLVGGKYISSNRFDSGLKFYPDLGD